MCVLGKLQTYKLQPTKFYEKGYRVGDGRDSWIASDELAWAQVSCVRFAGLSSRSVIWWYSILLVCCNGHEFTEAWNNASEWRVYYALLQEHSGANQENQYNILNEGVREENGARVSNRLFS